jgi:hypothetical protein
VWALDNDRGLWKWDIGMKSDEWVQLVRPLKKKKGLDSSRRSVMGRGPASASRAD